nr:Chain C, Lipoprotein lipase peptide [Homo sapiens]6WN4_D Chain D, Lipoprotein lipase peptide [Homo sapiens]
KSDSYFSWSDWWSS